MKDKFYVTTPIYYPNDIPHLGHAYTTIAADILARWNTLLGKEVFFLTGTDEHGKKLEKAAEKHNKKPKEFVDQIIPEFKRAWQSLNIEYNRFIRTTDKDHEKTVQEILQKCFDNGDIYKGTYSGLYCTDCEAYYTEKDATDKICPVHKRPLEVLEEESYFFKLSKYQKYLLEFYKKNPDFISPKSRANEIIARVKEGLKDFSISRTSFNWGIPLPFDKKHICYVWFDALINYISGIEYLDKKSKLKGFWPANVHIIGKDILWFHVVYWPAMLKSAGIENPKKVFAHGWWTVNSEKMGKSAGNAIKIDQLIEYAGVDSARYFLFREAPFGQDGDFSVKTLIERHNNELANKLGNLVSRVSALIESNGLEKSKTLPIKKVKESVENYLDNLEFDKALNEIFSFIDKINEIVQKEKPWETKDKKILYQLANAIKDITILLYPFIPQTAEKIAETFHFEIKIENIDKDLEIKKINKAEVLFKKIEYKEEIKMETKKETKNKSEKQETNESTSKISYDDFAKLDLRVGKILEVEDHPQADKLYVLKVDLGEKEPRTIVAGLRNRYKKSELLHKKAVFVSNLAPVKLRGIESNGMILAAANSSDSSVFFLTPEQDIEVGSKIR